MENIKTGWLFDVYPVQEGMKVWMIEENGTACSFIDPFHPTFYLHLDDQSVDIPGLVAKLRLPVSLSVTHQMELFSGEIWEVTAVTVHNPLLWSRCVRAFQRHLPHFVFYNSNIPVPQLYLYDREIFPLAYCTCAPSKDGRFSWQLLEAPDTFEAFNLPDLRVMTLRHDYDDQPSKYARSFILMLGYENRSYTIEEHDPAMALQSFNTHLERFDPDVILSTWGDAMLLPALAHDAGLHGVPLLLNRDKSHSYRTTKERSFWTYGEVIHRDAAFMLAGRWHIDTENSFIMDESGLEGIIELSRLTQLPVQKQARAAIGTGLASLQMSYAYRHRILIPAEKKEGEAFKTADELLVSDRGGLVFLPEAGCHERVAEMDFASMYPALMVQHNISPETINCNCCDNDAVPELGYTICERRLGLVPATLKPVLERRAYFKSRKNTATTPEEYQKYDRMQNALKWMLVTCFGYLGYKNARFGRIEAHEAVNAFSRETLLTAKEIAEAQGMHLVHAIIDCLWLTKPGATHDDYLKLGTEITEAVGIDISLEGIYNWLLFPASKTDPGMPTTGRYVGWYDHGVLKVRGLEIRRRDTPKYVKHVQARLLDLLAETTTVKDLRSCIPALLEEVRFYLHELRQGRVAPQDLLVRRRVQKAAHEYRNNNLNAMVVRDLANRGIAIKPGEMIEYIILDHRGLREPQKARSILTYQAEDGYDIEKYTEFLLKAVETLLGLFGYDLVALQTFYKVGGKRKGRCKGEQVQLKLPF